MKRDLLIDLIRSCAARGGGNFVKHCIIENISRIKNSVLFRGVNVKKGVHIKNSIVMQKSVIDSGANLEQVICDKNVHVTAGRQLKGDSSYPLVVKKGMVI